LDGDDDDYDDMNMNRAWKSITDSLGYYELEHHEPWFDKVFKVIRSKEAG
jgi:hypothetical protein